MPLVSTACPVLRKEKSVQKWEQDGTRARPQLVHCPTEAESSCRIWVCTAIHHRQCQLGAGSKERDGTHNRSQMVGPPSSNTTAELPTLYALKRGSL